MSDPCPYCGRQYDESTEVDRFRARVAELEQVEAELRRTAYSLNDRLGEVEAEARTAHNRGYDRGHEDGFAAGFTKGTEA
jgi:hypothetical protein